MKLILFEQSRVELEFEIVRKESVSRTSSETHWKLNRLCQYGTSSNPEQTLCQWNFKPAMSTVPGGDMAEAPVRE
jgi:hypothetical protein